MELPEPPTDVLIDEALLERWRHGDAPAGEELFERYYDAVERFFLNKITSAVQDLVQETFMRCVSGRERIREQFRSYLFGVAYNVLRGHLRDRYRDGQPLDVSETSVCDLQPGPATLAGRHHDHRLLLVGLRSLPIEDQVILELHYWEHCTTDDIARALDIPIGTTKGRLQRARAKLEAIMARLTDSTDSSMASVEQLDEWARQCRAHLALELDSDIAGETTHESGNTTGNDAKRHDDHGDDRE